MAPLAQAFQLGLRVRRTLATRAETLGWVPVSQWWRIAALWSLRTQAQSAAQWAARYRAISFDTMINHGRRTKCIAFGNMRIDAAVSTEVLSLIAPLGLDAALQAGTGRLRQIELALEQARY
jgi:hypothetical protein